MIVKPVILFCAFFLLSAAISVDYSDNDMPAYLLYNKKGKQQTYADMLAEAKEADVIFIGELHNNPISHWMQLKLTQSLFDVKGENLIVGAEMFEADNQLIMNEYLSGEISEKNFMNEMRLWKNYETDYKPIVEFCKARDLDFIATNIPRRYASIVYRKGLESLDSLSDDAKAYIAPLPIEYDPELPAYAKMKEMSGGHGGDNLPKAQAIKDATMAHFIAENMEEGKAFIHLNGAYHSDNYEGILWYLKKYKPELKVLTITTVLQSDVKTMDETYKNKADFILCVNSDMTGTH